MEMRTTLFFSVPRHCKIKEVGGSNPGRSRGKAKARKEANPKSQDGRNPEVSSQ
jgi:hypothetical protein